MYAEEVTSLAELAARKHKYQAASLPAHVVRAAAAGMYIGASVVLILTVGGFVAVGSPHLAKVLMGVCFGGALTIVLFAGSELSTGTHLVATLGVLTGRIGGADLLRNWGWTWAGNLLGSALLALLVVRAGVLEAEPLRHFVEKTAHAKMSLPVEQLVIRGVLANWLVCLAVWMNARMRSETGRILMIWWCMFIFITCSFEHSVANMGGLLIPLLAGTNDAAITWAAYGRNIAWVTLGNILGGAVFVAGLYYLASASLRRSPAPDAGLSTPARNEAKVGDVLGLDTVTR